MYNLGSINKTQFISSTKTYRHSQGMRKEENTYGAPTFHGRTFWEMIYRTVNPGTATHQRTRSRGRESHTAPSLNHDLSKCLIHWVYSSLSHFIKNNPTVGQVIPLLNKYQHPQLMILHVI